MAQTKKQSRKVRKVMGEFKEGTLKSSSGAKVKNPKQAVAIALSEAGVGKAKTMKTGGMVSGRSYHGYGAARCN